MAEKVVVAVLVEVGKCSAANYNCSHNSNDGAGTCAAIGLEEKGGNEIYTPQMSEKTYNRLLELGKMLVSRGFTVILDAKYDRASLRKPILEWCQSQDYPLQILHCTAPIEVLRDRVRQRTGDISDATPDLILRQQATAEPLSATEQIYVKTLNTTQDWQSQLDV